MVFCRTLERSVVAWQPTVHVSSGCTTVRANLSLLVREMRRAPLIGSNACQKENSCMRRATLAARRLLLLTRLCGVFYFVYAPVYFFASFLAAHESGPRCAHPRCQCCPGHDFHTGPRWLSTPRSGPGLACPVTSMVQRSTPRNNLEQRIFVCSFSESRSSAAAERCCPRRLTAIPVARLPAQFLAAGLVYAGHGASLVLSIVFAI